MSPTDAVFLALAVAPFLPRPPRWPWIGLAPPIAALAGVVGASLAGVGLAGQWFAACAPILVALLVALPALRFAPIALLLALPDYPDALTALVAALTWTAGLLLLDGLEPRLRACGPARLRGAPLRLLVTVTLYYTLLPLFLT